MRVNNLLSVTFLFFAASFSMQANSQQINSLFQLKHIQDLDTSKYAKKWEGVWGGISAIAFFSKDSILMVSDGDSDKAPIYSFLMNSQYKLSSAEKFFNCSKIESLRFNKSQGKFYYSFENNSKTGIGYIENNSSKTFFEQEMHTDNTSKNRGIESLTFDSNNNLWMAFESGGNKVCQPDFVRFYKFTPDERGNYDSSRKKIYAYPFDRCACWCPVQSDKDFDGNIGNGISEILAYENDSSKILVLERCFDGRNGNVKLYTAHIPADGNILTRDKVIAFDFNNNKYFDTAYKKFKPYNIEGMTWGDDEGGLQTLYLIGDNNYEPNLPTQIIKLKQRKN